MVAAADVFVCPSQWQEPLARVHYEAMASGLPIITTARGGNAEVIVEGENGIVIANPEDPQAFVEPLSYLLSNPSQARRMGEYGRLIAEEKYTWERVASDVLTVWQQTEQSRQKRAGLADELGDIDLESIALGGRDDDIDLEQIAAGDRDDDIQIDESELESLVTEQDSRTKLRKLIVMQLSNNNELLDTLLMDVKKRATKNQQAEISKIIEQTMADLEKNILEKEEKELEPVKPEKKNSSSPKMIIQPLSFFTLPNSF